MLKKILLLFTFLVLSLEHSAYCMFPINLFRRYDINFKTDRWPCERFEFDLLFEDAVKVQGRNSDNKEVNILQIWNKDQNALTMLRGFNPDSAIGKFAKQFNEVNDDGVIGHFCPKANLKAMDFLITGQYYLPHDFCFSLCLPFYSMRLEDVTFTDLTKDITPNDKLVKDKLTNDITKLVKDLGGLNLTGWKRTGIGDMVALMEWTKNFPQDKEYLKNVTLCTRLGLTIPTGLKRDEDQLFSIPFGNDGSWGILFGGGLDLLFGRYLKFGLDAEFLQLFGTTRDRRIKTDMDQTDLLFLAKTKTFREIGFTQRFNLYAQANKFIKGLSFRFAYQYIKHGEDKLWLFNNCFSDAVANSAESLQNWTIHQLLFDLNYDFINDFECPKVVPNISLFYKMPFNGRRAVLCSTVGIAFSLSF